MLIVFAYFDHSFFRPNDKNSYGETAHGTLVSLLRSWIGVLYFCDPSGENSKSGLSSIVRALHVQNSTTRVSYNCICLYFKLIECVSYIICKFLRLPLLIYYEKSLDFARLNG